MPYIASNILVRQTTDSLTDEEYDLLVMRRSNYLFATVTVYLLALLGYFWIWRSNYSRNNPDNKSLRINFSKSELESYQDSIPWLLILLFLGTTAFFIYFVVNSIRPLFKDTAQRKKILLYFQPIPEARGKDSQYCMRLPFEKEFWIDLTPEQYALLKGRHEICLCTTAYTHNPICLMAGEQMIKKWG